MPTLTVDDLVSREVNCCLSSLVSTLTQGGGAYVPEPKRGAYNLAELCDQAEALARSIDDWEEAARQDGWTFAIALSGTIEGRSPGWEPTRPGYIGRGETYLTGEFTVAAAAQRVCEQHGIDPYQREPLEFWAVSPWLARKLEEKGEKVDHDFAGLAVWARTTSGQGIVNDSVIVAIYNEMMAPKVEAGR